MLAAAAAPKAQLACRHSLPAAGKVRVCILWNTYTGEIGNTTNHTPHTTAGPQGCTLHDFTRIFQNFTRVSEPETLHTTLHYITLHQTLHRTWWGVFYIQFTRETGKTLN
jgi:hypothetical protein